jgi:cysteine synthase
MHLVAPSVASGFESLSAVIGNTPMLAIDCVYKGVQTRVFAKAEHLNFTGSIKDRMAYHVLLQARASGALAPGAPIVEATSGNTGISFAALGAALGHPVLIFMPDWMSRERQQLMTAFGAQLRLVSREQGGFMGCLRMSEEYARENPGTFLPRQFSNVANVEAHERTTGPEILRQLDREGLVPSSFVAGVGTGGTVMGVGRALRARHPLVRIHPVEPANSPTLSTGYKVGTHRIQGISDDFIPDILHLRDLDAVVSIDDGEAIAAARMLSRKLGLGVGISSGANFMAALRSRRATDVGVAVTVFSDDNKKYLSTDLGSAGVEATSVPDLVLRGVTALARAN